MHFFGRKNWEINIFNCIRVKQFKLCLVARPLGRSLWSLVSQKPRGSSLTFSSVRSFSWLHRAWRAWERSHKVKRAKRRRRSHDRCFVIWWTTNPLCLFRIWYTFSLFGIGTWNQVYGFLSINVNKTYKAQHRIFAAIFLCFCKVIDSEISS